MLAARKVALMVGLRNTPEPRWLCVGMAPMTTGCAVHSGSAAFDLFCGLVCIAQLYYMIMHDLLLQLDGAVRAA